MKKTEENFNFGGILIIIALIVLYNLYDVYYAEPKQKKEENS